MSDANYIFGSAEERHEWDRLSILQEEFDPGTTRRLDRLGVRPGWVCLEVGPGAGSVMNWPCDKVGQTGRVVAVDLNPRFVANIQRANLEIRRADVVKDQLEPGRYDLIHVRYALMHVPQRIQALTNIVRALKTGGWLLLEEPDFSTTHPAEETGVGADTFRRVYEATMALYGSVGIDSILGCRLPQLLTDHGLTGVDTEAELALTRGGSRRATIWRLAVENISERLQETGRANAIDIRQFIEMMKDPKTWYMDYVLVAAWGQRS
jgi:SAM-dependent methyltransferase